MRVSIVTISFNQARLLPRAIESVLAQDHRDLEYIVVDPGSTDGSREIIERYRPHLARVVLEPDEGPADGLNIALTLASGDVFARVNADDALLPGAIPGAVRLLAADPSLDLVYGQGYTVDEEERVLHHFRSHPFNALRYVYGGVNVMQQATFARRRAARGWRFRCRESDVLGRRAAVGTRSCRKAHETGARLLGNLSGSRCLDHGLHLGKGAGGRSA